MRGERLIPVVTSVGVQEGRCRTCGQRILWATRASTPGRPAKTLPWTPPRPWPLRSDRNDETGLVIEYWPAGSLHFATCKFPTTKKKTQAAREVSQ